MTARLLSVHPQSCQKIASLEVNHKILLLQSAAVNADLLRIPDMIMTSLILNTAQLRLIGKRNLNLMLFLKALIPPVPLSDIVIVKAKIPCSIKILPIIPHKLRPGIILYIILHNLNSPLFIT